MKHIFTLAVLMTAGTTAMYGGVCSVAALYDSNSPSCTETLTNVNNSGGSLTLTFSSLVNTGTDAASIFANLDDNAPIGLAGFTWTDSNGSFTQNGATALGYTVSITSCDVGFTCSITGYTDQVLIPSGSAADVVALTGLADENLDLSNQTANALNTVDLQTATKSGTYNGLATEISYESDVVVSETAISDTPEPATLILLATGLLGLGLVRRRRSARE